MATQVANNLRFRRHFGKIKRIIPVPLARPRDRASYDFVKIKEEVLQEFQLHGEKYFSYVI